MSTLQHWHHRWDPFSFVNFLCTCVFPTDPPTNFNKNRKYKTALPKKKITAATGLSGRFPTFFKNNETYVAQLVANSNEKTTRPSCSTAASQLWPRCPSLSWIAPVPLSAARRNRTTDKGTFGPGHRVGRGLLDECHGGGSKQHRILYHTARRFPPPSKQIPYHIYQASQH